MGLNPPATRQCITMYENEISYLFQSTLLLFLSLPQPFQFQGTLQTKQDLLFKIP
jgi:hypothetical protein